MHDPEEPAAGDPDPDELVPVARFGSVAAAEICRGALDAAGVRAVVSDAALASLDWLVIGALGGVRVMVPRAEAGRALELLAGMLGPGPAGRGGPALTGSLRACPRCGSTATRWRRPGAPLWAALSMLLGVPIFLNRKVWGCLACGHQWDPRREPESTEEAHWAGDTTGTSAAGGGAIFCAPWTGLRRAWAAAVLVAVLWLVCWQDFSIGGILRAAALALLVVILDATVTLRWNAVVLTPAGVRVERVDAQAEFPFADLSPARTPEGWPYLQAGRRPLVAGPDAAPFLSDVMVLRAADMDRLWQEVSRRKAAGSLLAGPDPSRS